MNVEALLKNPLEGIVPSNVTLVRLVQLKKASFPMLFTLSGILTLVSLTQL